MSRRDAASRRDMLTGSVATLLLTVAPAAGPAKAAEPVMPAVVAYPDAELIEACRLFPAAMAAVNAPTDADLDDDNPLWREYSRLGDIIGSTDPTTWEGWRAKALAAKAEATTLSGEERPDHTDAADWAWDLLNDMLRMRGEGGA